MIPIDAQQAAARQQPLFHRSAVLGALFVMLDWVAIAGYA